MAGNIEIFDDIVDPSVKQQLTDTATGLALLDAAFIKAANSANLLNEATATSKTPGQFAKNAEASNAATQRIIDNNEKTRLSEIRLQQAREKAFDDYEKKIAKQQADAARASAQNDAQTQKQIANQAKVDAAIAKSNEPFAKLLQSYKDSRAETENLAVSQGRLSQAYLDSNEKTKGLKTEIDSIRQGYGDSTGAVGKYENALSRLGGILQSRVFRLAATIIITDLAIKGAKAIYEYVASLVSLNSTLSESEERVDAFREAANGGDYKKAVGNIIELGVNIDIAKDKVSEQSKVVDEYNKTIGTITGSVDTFTEAEKGFQANSDKYIQAMLQQAAATVLNQKAQKDFSDTEEFILGKQQEQIVNSQKIAQIKKFGPNQETGGDPLNGGATTVVVSSAKQQISELAGANKDIQDQIDSANSKLKQRLLVRQNIMKSMFQSITGVGGDTTGQGNGVTDNNKLLTENANKAIEIDKQVQEAIINNESLSYSKRISATRKFGEDDTEIAQNNYNLQLTQINLSNQQKKGYELDYQAAILKSRNDTAKKIQGLEKADLEKRLTKIKDDEAIILNSDKSTYQQRLDAIAKFQKDSDALINKSPALSKQEKGNALLGISAEVVTQTQEAQNKLSEALSKQLETILKKDQDAAQKSIDGLNAINDSYFDKLENLRQNDVDDVNDLYAKGKISKQQYQDALLQIEDDYNKKRAKNQLDTDLAILSVRQAEYNNALGDANGNADAVPTEVKSAVSSAQAKVKTDKLTLGDATVKQSTDNTKIRTDAEQKERDRAIEGIQDLEKLQDDASKAIQNQYAHEIDLLEQRKKLIEDTAKSDIDRVNSSILSEKDKQNEINIINSKAQAAQAQIDAKEASIKTKQAEAQKAQAIASIIENTAIAILKLPADGGLLGVAAIPIIAALGAAELATVIAQPIPKFEKGGLTAGGGLIWGERGMEMATLPSGERMFSPNGATYASMPKGTVITPHKELLAAVGRNNTDRAEIGWREVVAALNRQKQVEQKRPYVKVNVYPDRSGLRR